jgi:hypothetical protein
LQDVALSEFMEIGTAPSGASVLTG